MPHTPLRELFAFLSASPELHPVATKFAVLSRTAVSHGDAVFPRPGSPTLFAAEPLAASVSHFGEVDLSLLLRGGANDSQQTDVLTVLVVGGEAGDWPEEVAGHAALGRRWLWLETYCGLHCLRAAVALLDLERQRQIAEGLVAAMSSACMPPLSQSELRVATAWLATHSDPQITALTAAAADHRDRAMVDTHGAPFSSQSSATSLEGELGPCSRGPWGTAVMALSGALLATSFARAVARFVFHYRAPVTVALGPDGLQVEVHREIFGRPWKHTRWVVPLEQIREVIREVRWSRLGLVAGLGALAVGTYLGARLFVDGLRAPGLSFPLLGMGVLAVILGLILDFGLTSLSDTLLARSRIIIRTRKGQSFALSVPDREKVDSLLNALATSIAAGSR